MPGRRKTAQADRKPASPRTSDRAGGQKRPPSGHEGAWGSGFAALLVALLTALAYSNAAPAVFVHDDKLTVPPNIDRGLAALPQLFMEPAWAAANTEVPTYRPLLISSFVVEGHLWRDRPTSMHRTNIVIHVMATLVLFFLLEALRTRTANNHLPGAPPGRWPPLASAVAALIFGVHPIHTEIVDSVFNRSEMLATAGVLGALWVLVRWVDAKPVLAWGLAALLYFLALLCRESAAVLPALAVIVLGLLRLGGPWRARAQRLAPILVLLVPLGIYLLLRHNALSIHRGGLARGIDLAATHPDWWVRVEHMFVTLRESVRMMVWPTPLRCSYGDLPVAGVAVSFLLLAVLVGYAIATYRDTPTIAAGIGFFYLALLPSTQLFGDPGTVELAAERYVYLPSVGLAIALTGAFTTLARRQGSGAVAAVAVVILSTLGWLTVRRNVDWHSQEALWRVEVKNAPWDGNAWMQLTSELLRLNRWAEIEALCRDHLADNSEHAQFHNNCATAAMRLGRYPEAETLFRRAIALGAGSVGHANLARMLARLDRLPDAQKEYQAAVDAEVNDAMRHVRRGEMLLRVWPDRGADARAEFQAALAIDPAFAPAKDWIARIGNPTTPPGSK